MLHHHIRSLACEFHKLVQLNHEKGITKGLLSKTIGLSSSAFSNLSSTLYPITEKDKRGTYLIEERHIENELQHQFEMHNNVSWEQLFRLGQYVELLRSYQPSYQNTPIKYIKQSEETFLGELHWNDIRQIDLIGHTGENIVKQLKEVLLKNYANTRNIRIRILVRSLDSETSLRQEGIKATVKDVEELKENRFNIDLLFYDSLPHQRAIICYRKDSPSRCAYIGSYYFPGYQESKRTPFATVIKERTGRHFLIDKTCNWFQNYWGKCEDEAKMIHTIILDFDDTIVRSHPVQIKAWVTTILKLVEDYRISKECLREELRNLDPITLREKITVIFFRKQMANKIISEIFERYPEGWPKERIQQLRFKLRQDFMFDLDQQFEEDERAEIFNGFVEEFQALSRQYNVMILSATDEQLIKNYFRNSDMTKELDFLGSFKYIFGKKESVYAWGEMERKSRMIVKISRLTGIPISRMVYVGDNDKDYRSAKSIGIDFIEAAIFSDKVRKYTGRDSLIFSNEERVRFKHWSQFSEALLRLEGKKKGLFVKRINCSLKG